MLLVPGGRRAQDRARRCDRREDQLRHPRDPVPGRLGDHRVGRSTSPTGVSMAQAQLAREVLVIVAMALLAAYFYSVRAAMSAYLRSDDRRASRRRPPRLTSSEANVANALAMRVEETLRPVIGSVLASVSVDVESKRIGKTPDTLEHGRPEQDVREPGERAAPGGRQGPCRGGRPQGARALLVRLAAGLPRRRLLGGLGALVSRRHGPADPPTGSTPAFARSSTRPGVNARMSSSSVSSSHAERHRARRSGKLACRVRRDGARSLGVAQVVEVDAADPLGLGHDRGERVRVARGDPIGDRLGERADPRELPDRLDGQDDVEPLAPGGLDVGLEAERAALLGDEQRGDADLRPADVRRRDPGRRRCGRGAWARRCATARCAPRQRPSGRARRAPRPSRSPAASRSRP